MAGLVRCGFTGEPLEKFMPRRSLSVDDTDPVKMLERMNAAFGGEDLRGEGRNGPDSGTQGMP